MAPGRGRGRVKQEVDPVPDARSVKTLLLKQNQGRLCSICRTTVSLALYRTHVDACNVADDDSDLEVVEVLSSSEAKGRRAGPEIVLGDESMIVKEEKQEQENSPQLTDTPPPGELAPRKRRSTRLSVEEKTKKMTPSDTIKKRKDRGEESSLALPVLGDDDADTESVASLAAKQGSDCSDTATTAQSTQDAASQHIQHDYQDDLPVTLPTAETSTQQRRRSKRHEKTIQQESAQLSTSTQVAGRSCQQRGVSKDTGAARKGRKEAATTAITTAIPKSESLAGAAQQIVKKIESLLDTSVDAGAQEMLSQEYPEEAVIQRGIPYFVRYMLMIMRRVLSTPHVNRLKYDEEFWQNDIRVFDQFTCLNNQTQQLLMRIYLRKRGWLPVQAMKKRYVQLSDSIDFSVTALVGVGFLDDGKLLTDLEDALKLMQVGELKTLAKECHVDDKKGKQGLIKGLLEHASKQRGIFGGKATGNDGVVAARICKSAKKLLGRCVRLSSRVEKVLLSLLTLYAPTEVNSALALDKPGARIEQEMLYMLLQLENKQVRFPAPNPCPTIIPIYESRDDLYDYVDAKMRELEMCDRMAKSDWAGVVVLAIDARRTLMSQERGKTLRCAALSSAHRRFTATWVLLRCVSHGADALQRQKQHANAVEWHRWILANNDLAAFCVCSRGTWWDRLALNLDVHCKEKEEAVKEIERGMDDASVGEKDKLLLEDRALRLTRGDWLPRIACPDPVRVDITCEILGKCLGDERVNRFIVRGAGGDAVAEASVEEVAKRHYHNNGWQYGAIWHTAFGLLFYDVIFDHSIEGAWTSEMQMNPLDLNSAEFYGARREGFEREMAWLERSALVDRVSRCERSWRLHEGESNSECSWSIGWEQFETFIRACPVGVLVGVCTRVMRDYRNCRSGFPDLTLWKSSGPDGVVAVVEVKGPGDRLSTKQRLWLREFRSLGVQAEVCHVSATKGKTLV